MNILVTGGAGYIGSHTCVELLSSGYGVVVVDNLCNSNPKSLERVEKLTGKKPKFYQRTKSPPSFTLPGSRPWASPLPSPGGIMTTT